MVTLVWSLAPLVKGLIVGLTKAGVKGLARRNAGFPLFGKMSPDSGYKVAKDIVKQSPWLQELKRIKGIKGLDKQYKSIGKFVDDYAAHTQIRIKVVPGSSAGDFKLTGGNWGTYSEKTMTDPHARGRVDAKIRRLHERNRARGWSGRDMSNNENL